MNRKFIIYVCLIGLMVGVFSLTQNSTKAVEAFDVTGVSHDKAVVKVDKETILYKVGEGDTLWSISQRYSVDPEIAAAMNNMEVKDPIIVGQILTLPNEQLVMHTVASGETLWRISQNYGVDVNVVARENGIEDETFVRTGQTLLIPKPVYLKASAKDESYVKTSTLDKVKGKLLDWLWPTKGVISSPFGMRDGEPHRGLDIANEMSKPIYAALDGKVIFAGPRGTYGNAIIIDHSNGYKTLYAHSSKLLVKAGDVVTKGQEIAKIGSTGRSTGPHLHFEIRENDVHQNPLKFLPPKAY